MAQKGRKKKLRIAKQRRADILKKANVIGVGVGEKYKDGKTTHQTAMVCLVNKKVDKEQLSKEDLLPTSIKVGRKDVPVDVIAVGTIRALSSEHRFNHRPLVTGISCGHFATTAGTLGLFVEKDGAPYILSNNHILANSNEAQIGDAIYQPGPHDGGRSRHTVATLSAFPVIEFGLESRNTVDAALAKIIGYNDNDLPIDGPPVEEKAKNWFVKVWDKITNTIRSIIDALIDTFFGKGAATHHAARNVNVVVDGEVVEGNTPPAAPQTVEFSNAVLNMPAPITGEVADVEVGQFVQKSGRTTGYTTSEVIATDVTVSVEFGVGQVAIFEGQTIAGDFSLGGDSGSAIFDIQGNAVGLLFAGSDTVTIFTPMDTVFQELGIDRIWR